MPKSKFSRLMQISRNELRRYVKFGEEPKIIKGPTVKNKFNLELTEHKLLMALLYLKAKHGQCTLENMLTNNNNRLTLDMSTGRRSPTVNYAGTPVTRQNKKFMNSIKKCKSRFIFFLLLIRRSKSLRHANMLLYDFEKKELEVFEPNGKSVPKIDRIIKKTFKPILRFKTFYPSASFCEIGPQRKTRKLITNDMPIGFCFYWSVFYADLRLSFPDITRRKIINHIFKNAAEISDSDDWGSYIRSYSVFITLIYKYFKASSKDNPWKSPKKIADEVLSDVLKIIKSV